MWVRALLWIAAATGMLACDDDSDEIPGTYRTTVFESRDTCDDSRDSYALEIEIARQEGGFRVEVPGGALTGELDQEGFLVVAGTVTEDDGTRPREVQLEMDIRRGRIIEAKGRVTWNGTFPDIPGVCVQEFDFTGFRRDAVAPILG